jgi:uncharacterized protein YndB with AHSA1/START domain
MNEDVDLVISRRIAAPRDAVWAAWADPGRLARWWCPAPWTTELVAFEFAAGGALHTRMRGPDGDSSEVDGAFVEIVPGERIVWTTLLRAGWRPAPEPWMPMTAIVTLADEYGGTRYVATVRHRDAASRERHAGMGFHEGWGACIEQLERVALAGR